MATESPIFIDLPDSTPNTPKTTVIQVVGVGGGGGNAVANMYRENIPGIRFSVCNTDAKQLSDSPVPQQLQLGSGLGAGGRPELGQRLAEESLEHIQQILHPDTDMLFITAGMGGGTGTGAAPIVAREARKKGILTVGIVTIPFLFELKSKIDIALDGLEEMRKEVDTLLVINNERLRQIYADYTIRSAFQKADDTLTKAVRSIVEIINMRGISNLDFRDIDTCLRKGGVAVMSSGTASGEGRLQRAIEEALYSPLLNKSDIFQSKSIRIALFFPPDGPNAMRMDELDDMNDFMQNFQTDIDAKFGYAEDETLTNEIRVTLLAAGFRTPGEETTQEEDPQKEIRRALAYGSSDGKQVRPHRVHIFRDEEMDNVDLISAIESSPTYKRSEIKAQQLKSMAQANASPQATITPEGSAAEM